LSETEHSDRRCQACGANLPDEVTAPPPPTPAGAVPQGGEQIAEYELVPKHRDSALPLEANWKEAKIRRGEHGETLAVAALLVPLVAQGLMLAFRFDSVGIELALSWGTVAVTALLLAVDAAFLGSTDLNGVQRSSPIGLFFGMLFLWIVCYPVAFFRRRHFGRPNLGPLALLVAAFFIAVPFVSNFARFGIVGAGVPTCNSKEVVALVDDIIRKSDLGASVVSISEHKEISYDPAKQIRKGQCQVKTHTDTLTATYTVKLLDPKAGTFQVDVDPIVPEDPPLSTDAEVIATLERLIRQGPNGQQVKFLGGLEEIRYDRENKIRHGRCRVTMQNQTVNVAYKVYWVDRKLGQFQVEIEQ
jgi:hypothetical protein